MRILVKEEPHLGAGWGVSGIRAYRTPADRKRAIAQIFRTGRANYFTCYRDVRGKYALMYGASNWVKGPKPYVNW